MLPILSSPIWATVASILAALFALVWRAFGDVLEKRSPANVQMLLERIIPPLVEATEKTKAYASGRDKLAFAFDQLDRIAEAYGMKFPASVARALIEQHVLTLPHTGKGPIAPPASASYPNSNAPATDTNPMPTSTPAPAPAPANNQPAPATFSAL